MIYIHSSQHKNRNEFILHIINKFREFSIFFFCFGLQAYQLIIILPENKEKCVLIKLVSNSKADNVFCFFLQTLSMKVTLLTSVQLISNFETGNVLLFFPVDFRHEDTIVFTFYFNFVGNL